MGRVARCFVPLRRAVSVTAGALALGAFAPVAAEATTSCEYNAGAEVLFVKMNADNDSATLRLIAVNTIDVRESGGIVTCSGGTPTTTNTEFVFVNDESSNGNTTLSVFEAPNLAAVPITYTSGGGNLDTLQVFGFLSTPVQFLVGTNGVSTDGNTTKDINLIGTPESIVFLGGLAGDTFSARGGGNTGGPVTGPSLEFRGEPGNDTLEGGEIGDLLDGGTGNDTLRGFGGEDALVGDAPAGATGDDLYDGGAGGATARFGTAQNGVTVDLAKAGPQATGEGNDAFVSVANVDGSKFADVLLGDAGPNRLTGQSGNDFIDGRGGNDGLNGGFATDTVTYAEAPAGVAADLSAGKASGGYGSDSVLEFENLIGSAFADALTGSAADNAIAALAGADTVQALAGADRVDVRDGGPDNASCGSELDAAIADRLSVDTVQADCELVDALPEPPGNDGGGGAGGGNGGASGGGGAPGGAGAGAGAKDTKVTFLLRGAARQRLLVQGGVILKLRCPLEDCTVTLRAAGRLPRLGAAATSAKRKLKLKPRRIQLPAGPPRIVRLPLSKSQLGLVETALGEGERPKLRVTATARDSAGNSAPAQLTVTAKP
jgi:hemolysin type calcium-binding protein